MLPLEVEASRLMVIVFLLIEPPEVLVLSSPDKSLVDKEPPKVFNLTSLLFGI
jgi:hypothetical protein